MFDENINTILSQGQEEVPAHIWEGISSKLDRIEESKRVKPIRLWFGRSAIAVAAAAAVVAGVFIGKDNSSDFVPQTPDRNLIAVAVSPKIETPEYISSPSALAERKSTYVADAADEVSEAKEIMDILIQEETAPAEDSKQENTPVQTYSDSWNDPWTEAWPEETAKQPRKKGRTSLVVSGVAGTNGTQSNGAGPIRRPAMSTSKPKTGVEQKSAESTYGLPVTIGTGVKIDINDRWAIGVGANYTILARKFFGTFTLVNEAGTIVESVSSDIRNIQQYIGIPINAFYNIVDNDYMNFYAYAGGTVERCVSDKYDILNTKYVYPGTVKGVQLSTNVGIGVEFLLGRHLGLYVDPSLHYYFDCNQPKSIRTAQPLMLGLEMGLRVKL